MTLPAGAAESLEERVERDVHARFALAVPAFAARVRERQGVEPGSRLWLDDLYLATACADGEEAAWRELEERHFDYMRAFARRFGLPDADAADVAESVIGDLWRRGAIASYAGRSALRTWLGALITNAALNARARERRAAAVPDSAAPAVDPPDPDAGRLASVLADSMSQALRRLPPADRLLIRLYYGEGLTLGQIGAIERTSKATLSRSLKRIRAALREHLAAALAERRVAWAEARSAFESAELELDLATLLEDDAQPNARSAV